MSIKSHVKNKPEKQVRPEDEAMTMVIHLGEVGASAKELCADLKVLLAPFTFPKLRVRSNNKLKDFLQVATPLGAKMLMLVRCSLDKMTLELTRFPRGPTLYFNVHRFATIKDVHRGVEDTAMVNKTTRTEPCLVLDGFTKSDEDEVTVSMLQGLFPEIKLADREAMKFMKRVVIASKGEDGVISIRHYMIQKKDLEVNYAIKRIVDGKAGNLAEYESYDEYILKGLSSKRTAKNKCAVQLQEIGPRIDMSFKQVETGVFGGMKISEVKERPSAEKKPFKYRPPSQDQKKKRV